MASQSLVSFVVTTVCTRFCTIRMTTSKMSASVTPADPSATRQAKVAEKIAPRHGMYEVTNVTSATVNANGTPSATIVAPMMTAVMRLDTVSAAKPCRITVVASPTTVIPRSGGTPRWLPTQSRQSHPVNEDVVAQEQAQEAADQERDDARERRREPAGQPRNQVDAELLALVNPVAGRASIDIELFQPTIDTLRGQR